MPDDDITWTDLLIAIACGLATWLYTEWRLRRTTGRFVQEIEASLRDVHG